MTGPGTAQQRSTASAKVGDWSRRARGPLMLSHRARRLALSAWVITCAMLVAAILIVVLQLRSDRLAHAAWTAGMQTAGKRAERILSYHAKTIDQDLAASKAMTTGEFQRQFADLTARVVAPAARLHNVNTDAHAVAVSVVRSAAGSVTVLVFVNQDTTSDELPAPRIDGSRVELTLHKAGNSWLVSDLHPV